MTLVERIEVMRAMARRNETIVPGALIDLLNDLEPVARDHDERIGTLMNSLTYHDARLLCEVIKKMPANFGSVFFDDCHAPKDRIEKVVTKLAVSGLAIVWYVSTRLVTTRHDTRRVTSAIGTDGLMVRRRPDGLD